MHLSKIARCGCALVVGAATAAGLSACEGPSVAAGPQALLLHVSAPIREPIWSDADDELVGLTSTGSRVEAVDPGLSQKQTTSRLSAPIAGLGENVAPGMPDRGVVYVPQTEQNQVAVLRVSDLHRIGTMHVGPQPSYLSTDVGADSLLALSAGGQTVTGRDFEHHRIVTRQRVHAGPEAEIDGPERERVVEYHVTGPDGIEHYLFGAKRGQIGVPVTDAVGDEIKVTRLYVAESGTDKLVAVDSGRAAGGMDEVGHVDVGAPVRYVDADSHRVYAATDEKLVILETRSYGGFPGGHIPVLKTIDYRKLMPAELRHATLSGVVSGTNRIYLTFSDAPFVLSIVKPNV